MFCISSNYKMLVNFITYLRKNELHPTLFHFIVVSESHLIHDAEKTEDSFMAKEKKLTQSEIDGVQYRRAKLWQIILVACNAFIGMSIYSLINMASYAASIGFGISTAVVGVILTCTRILDGITDPMLAFIYDKVNTRFGKIRILIIIGFAIEALALMTMYKIGRASCRERV